MKIFTFKKYKNNFLLILELEGNGWNVTNLLDELRKQYPDVSVRQRSRRHASICSTLNTMEAERLRAINPERKR